jgi:hypothetical protein
LLSNTRDNNNESQTPNKVTKQNVQSKGKESNSSYNQNFINDDDDDNDNKFEQLLDRHNSEKRLTSQIENFLEREE